jgi:hypothetical protein
MTIKKDIIYALKEAALMYPGNVDNIIENASRLANVPTSWVNDVYKNNKGVINE